MIGYVSFRVKFKLNNNSHFAVPVAQITIVAITSHNIRVTGSHSLFVEQFVQANY